MPGGKSGKATRSKKEHLSSMTTMKIARRYMQYIEEKADSDESVDQTLRRLLKIGKKGKKQNGPISPTTTIKVSRMVMERIKKESKPKESRDMTLGRLLGIEPDDGNLLQAPASVPQGMDRESTSVQPNDGNVAKVEP